MKKTTILFDLDGTLLPMDQDLFTTTYFKDLAVKLAPLGYDPHSLAGNIWAGVAAMVKNDGSRTNEAAFWEEFSHIYGEKARDDAPVFEDFYAHEFENARSVCGFSPQAGETVRRLKKLGYRVVLATNPIFPAVATRTRIRWTGLEPEDFEFITTYENSHYSKPNPRYFQEVLERIGCTPEECLMVGNDVTEDGAAGKIGVEVFFLTDCLINQAGQDISQTPHGGWEDLMAYIQGKGE